MLWNDIGYPAAADLDALFGDYFDRVPDGVVNNRFDWVRQSAGQVHADFLTPEYSTDGAPERKWESTRGIGTSFGFNREEGDDDYLAADDLVRLLVDVVSHGGNLLLNVGPTGDGTIPFVQARRLLALGWWLQVNGEAIYGTRPWSHAGRARPATASTCASPSATARSTRSCSACRRTERVELVDVAPDDGAIVDLLGRSEPLPWIRTGRRDRGRATGPATRRPGDHVAGVSGSGCRLGAAC